MTTDTTIITERQDGIARIQFQGPEQRNALSCSTMNAAVEELESINRDPSISVVLLTGQGPAFCAGFDLQPVVEDPARLNDFIEGLSLLLRSIRRNRAVVISAVQGAAIAGGCAIVSACDLVVASPDARLGYPVHPLGLSPVVSSPTLMQMVGDGAARAMLMSGKLIDGTTAHRLGLVTHVTGDPEASAEDLARRISGHGPLALAATKRWLNELDESLEDRRFTGPVEGSEPLASDGESMELLRSRWGRKG